MKSKLILLTFILSILTSCGIQINEGFIDAISDSTPTPTSATSTLSVDQTDDDNTTSGFGGGSHTGTTYSSSVLTLNTTTNNTELDESWTPQYSSIVSYWQAENNWLDSIGSNDGTVVNDVSFSTNSKIGNYTGFFDGQSDADVDYVNLGNDATLRITNNISISLWYTDNLASSTEHTGLLTKNNITGSGGAYSMTLRTGRTVTFSIEDPGGTGYSCTSSFVTNNGNWHHAVGSYSPSNYIRLYLDGVLACENTTSIPASIQDWWSGVKLGSNWNHTDINQGHNGFIDEIAIWNSTLSADEVALIYSRQSAKFAGEMKSRIIDSLDTNSQWTNLDWITTLPFGKELPGSSGSESSSDYSSLIGSTGATSDDNLMSGLEALWHLNGDFTDSSGNGRTLTNNGGVDFKDNGRFSGNIDTDGSYARITDDIGITSYPFTFSIWVRLDTIPSATEAVMDLAFSGSTTINYSIVVYSGGSVAVRLRTGTSFESTGAQSIIDGKWHHIVARFDSSTSRSLYVDGKFISTNTATRNFATINRFALGTHYDGSLSSVADLNIDEVAVWSRSLHDDEIIQLYRRGANRINYQVRSCANNDCSDQDALTGDGWKGPGGNYLTYFSELYNNSSVTATCTTAQECYSSELSLQGDVGVTKPSIYFNSFGTDGLIGIDNNRYFQYRVIMESDDENTACDSGTATCMPELKSVTIGPEHSYEE